MIRGNTFGLVLLRALNIACLETFGLSSFEKKAEISLLVVSANRSV